MSTKKIELAVSKGSGVRHQIRVLEKRLGDGYTQRAADGLNNVALKYEAVWTGLTKEEAGELVVDLRRWGGVETFKVETLPDGLSETNWICKDWSVEWVSAERRNIRAMLEEDFSL
ncbi:MAG: phage tail protein [Acidobacteria bacterium]|nr:phage tail protein [Acidobacteriota bacterium]MXZ36957.1 phage tail protein [Holophagales bacterium]